MLPKPVATCLWRFSCAPESSFVLLLGTLAVVASLTTAEAFSQPRYGRPHGGRPGAVYVGVGGFWGWGGPFYSPYYWPWWGYPSFGWGPAWYYGAAYDPTSEIRLQVTPKQAEVFVDGYLAGTVDDFDGAFQRLRLMPGEHELVIYLDGYRTVRQKLLLTAGADLKVRHVMEPLAPGEVPDPRPQPLAPPPPAQAGPGAPAPQWPDFPAAPPDPRRAPVPTQPPVPQQPPAPQPTPAASATPGAAGPGVRDPLHSRAAGRRRRDGRWRALGRSRGDRASGSSARRRRPPRRGPQGRLQVLLRRPPGSSRRTHGTQRQPSCQMRADQARPRQTSGSGV